MIETIDRHYDTISKIQLSAKYSATKQEYLGALSDLRMACVDLAKAEDAGSSVPWDILRPPPLGLKNHRRSEKT